MVAHNVLLTTDHQPPPRLDLVSEKPYRFVPPYRPRFWTGVMQPFLPPYLRRSWGIEHVAFCNVERLHASLAAGHGIVLAPNHTRHCDPFVMGCLQHAAGRPFFQMASWHLFMNGGWQAWMIRRLGGFSVFREGMDRAAINTAIDILAMAERPLVIFPEGFTSYANDHLNPLMEGAAFIARTAADRRAKNSPGGKVVIHPVAIKYHFHGDLRPRSNRSSKSSKSTFHGIHAANYRCSHGLPSWRKLFCGSKSLSTWAVRSPAPLTSGKRD